MSASSAELPSIQFVLDAESLLNHVIKEFEAQHPISSEAITRIGQCIDSDVVFKKWMDLILKLSRNGVPPADVVLFLSSAKEYIQKNPIEISQELIARLLPGFADSDSYKAQIVQFATELPDQCHEKFLLLANDDLVKKVKDEKYSSAKAQTTLDVFLKNKKYQLADLLLDRVAISLYGAGLNLNADKEYELYRESKKLAVISQQLPQSLDECKKALYHFPFKSENIHKFVSMRVDCIAAIKEEDSWYTSWPKSRALAEQGCPEAILHFALYYAANDHTRKAASLYLVLLYALRNPVVKSTLAPTHVNQLKAWAKEYIQTQVLLNEHTHYMSVIDKIKKYLDRDQLMPVIEKVITLNPFLIVKFIMKKLDKEACDIFMDQIDVKVIDLKKIEEPYAESTKTPVALTAASGASLVDHKSDLADSLEGWNAPSTPRSLGKGLWAGVETTIDTELKPMSGAAVASQNAAQTPSPT